jgi:hypothetical protein
MGEGARRGLASKLIVADRRGLPPWRVKGGSCVVSVGGVTAELGGTLGGELDLKSAGLAKAVLKDSLRNKPVPLSALGSGMAGCDGACAKRPATIVLARRACCATAGSFSGSSASYNGGGPNFRNG